MTLISRQTITRTPDPNLRIAELETRVAALERALSELLQQLDRPLAKLDAMLKYIQVSGMGEIAINTPQPIKIQTGHDLSISSMAKVTIKAAGALTLKGTKISTN